METAETRPTARRDRESGRGAPADERGEGQYDLLTAALIGAAIGASATLLLRGAPRAPARRPVLATARRRVKRAGESTAAGARWAADHLRPEELRDQLGGMVESARDAINSAVEEEIRDLRRSVRRQRKKLGL